MKYSTTQYANLFSSLLEKTSPHNRKHAIRDFAHMLEENGDLKNDADILYAIEKKLYEKSGTVKKEVIEAKDEPSLIGGIKIKIGDTIIDNSIQSRINNLKTAFK